MNARSWLVAGAIPCAAVALVLLGRPEPAIVAPSVADAAGPLSVADDNARQREPGESATPTSPSTQALPPAPVAQGAVSPLPAREAAGPLTQLILDAQSEPPPPLVANETVFMAESIDAQWAPMAEAQILDRIAQEPGLRLLDLRVECRTTMCRVQMTQPRVTEERASPVTFLNKAGYQIRFIVALDNQAGGRGSIAYLVRPGTRAN
jgi:hypothetical protein